MVKTDFNGSSQNDDADIQRLIEEYRRLARLCAQIFRSEWGLDQDGTPDSLIEFINSPNLVQTAHLEGLLPLFWDQVRPHIDESSRQYDDIKILVWKAGFTMRLYQETMAELIATLRNHEIVATAFDSFALAHDAYRQPYHRVSSTIKLYINKNSLPRTKGLLQALDYRVEESFDKNNADVLVSRGNRSGKEIVICCYQDPGKHEETLESTIQFGEASMPIVSPEEQWASLLDKQFMPTLRPPLIGYLDMATLLRAHSKRMNWPSLIALRPNTPAVVQNLCQLFDMEIPAAINEEAHPPSVAQLDLGLPSIAEVRNAPRAVLPLLFFPSAWWLSSQYPGKNRQALLTHHYLALLDGAAKKTLTFLRNPHHDNTLSD